MYANADYLDSNRLAPVCPFVDVGQGGLIQRYLLHLDKPGKVTRFWKAVRVPAECLQAPMRTSVRLALGV